MGRVEMSQSVRTLADRFRRQRLEAEEVWLAGVVEMQLSVVGQGGSPWCAICVSLRSKRINITEPAMGRPSKVMMVLEALTVKGGGQGIVGYRQGRLVVGDGEV